MPGRIRNFEKWSIERVFCRSLGECPFEGFFDVIVDTLGWFTLNGRYLQILTLFLLDRLHHFGLENNGLTIIVVVFDISICQLFQLGAYPW